MGKEAEIKKPGKIDLEAMRKLVNKKTGLDVAHDLTKENPTSVKQWIPTGSRWLDSIICRSKMAGIPVGKITEIAGLSASGKSFMAAQIAANANKMGMIVVYFDAESSIDPAFLERAGCDLKNLLYIQAVSVEKVLETIQELMSTYLDQQMVFIWDSIAATASEKDIEGDFNPQSSMAVKPRIFAKAFPKLTPGGKAIGYFSSLRIWLTKRKAKAAYVNDENGFRIGSEIKVKLEKSRFGTEGRNCTFKILWGSDVGIQDEESWFTAIKLSGSDRFSQSGAWCKLITKGGKELKFQASKWAKHLEDKEFKQTVFEIMQEEIINRFDKGGGEIKIED